MNINLETADLHAVQAYSERQIQINSVLYEKSLIVCNEAIITDLLITDIQDIDEHYINLLTQFKPKIIIIGHEQSGTLLSMSIINQLSQQGVGVECMSIGAASRTYNVLLSEHRAVVAGFIFGNGSGHGTTVLT